METLRYDIVERDGGWLITDGHGQPRVFLTLSEALSVARMDASSRAGPSEIHLWRDGVPSQIHRSSAIVS